MEEVFQYKTEGTCCQLMLVLTENGILKDVNFIGGCNGNLKGIKELVKGMKIEDVISKLSGITCGSKPTSCPDQLAKCLSQVLQKTN